MQDKYIQEIGQLVLRCEDLCTNSWDSVAVVYDIGDGHTANSGFLYHEERVYPVSLEIEEEPLLLDDTITEFRNELERETGHRFVQLLIQMENQTGRIKIDFEFDSRERWAIQPSNFREMRETLRPNFD